MNILDRICEKRRRDVEASKKSAATSEDALRKRAKERPKPSNLYDVLASNSSMHIAAEFKRASPSKGDIATHLSATEQAVRYARAGASVVSVLTEPHWFKGSLDDMQNVSSALRDAFRKGSLKKRPLVLRKDFVLDTYQILEARAYGADTVLIIVAAMKENETLLKTLIDYSRSLDMEPLVEVNSTAELDVAVAAGANVVGVNNRDLRTFQVDLRTTDRCALHLQKKTNARPVILMALSGVKRREHVENYENIANGRIIRGVLVGEALMRASNPGQMIDELLGRGEGKKSSSPSSQRVCVKICGITSVEDAMAAARSGADMIGLIFVPKSKRCVDQRDAVQIVKAIRSFRESGTRAILSRAKIDDEKDDAGSWYSRRESEIRACCGRYRPLVVGVFQNQTLELIESVVESVGIDIAQLHGQETPSFASKCSVPTISVVHVHASTPSDDLSTLDRIYKRVDGLVGKTDAILLDTCIPGGAKGGTGKTFDWTLVRDLRTRYGIGAALAGGLDPKNVSDAIETGRPWCVDVAGGVAMPDGVKKDHTKVASFITNA